MQKIVEYSDLANSDLYVDALYKGGNNKNASDDPINKLIGVGNQGGFRYLGSSRDLGQCKIVVLYTSGDDPDWPDSIDLETGSFTYYGDNKSPGHQLHDTPRKGNLLLRNIFDAFHSGNRVETPPIFVFTKGVSGRDVIFKGLCVPGFHGYSQTEDLVAVWKTKANQRFQNYRAIFSVLDIAVISKMWITDVRSGLTIQSKFCPATYHDWINSGNPKVLNSQRTKEYRSRVEQTPQGIELEILTVIYNFFKDNPHGFERCAAEVVALMDKNFVSYELTRPWLDGGRDATGNYKIGNESTSIKVEYALEAKCYSLDNAVGVRETSRLISRLRHRQFGILVTTSYVHIQAYKEIINDKHPVIIIAGADIAMVLKKSGINTADQAKAWLGKISYTSVH